MSGKHLKRTTTTTKTVIISHNNSYFKICLCNLEKNANIPIQVLKKM
jgi:hypothetical protein